jgi:hypothetical protein
MSLSSGAVARRLPTVLLFVSSCPFVAEFEATAEFEQSAIYDSEKQLSVLPDGSPLYCVRYPTPPTSTLTPGHTIPAGYTSTGKYKPPKYVQGKTDKRAGK